jgi:putative transposase
MFRPRLPPVSTGEWIKAKQMPPNQRQVRGSQADKMRTAHSILGTETTHIRSHEGWVYLAVVVDLFSRQVVDCSMGRRFDTDLVLDAPVNALWRHRPKQPVTVHSDQVSRSLDVDWQDFLPDHNLIFSRRRCGNRHNNAMTESFFRVLKRKRICRKIYSTHDAAKADVFNYVVMFDNPNRR